MNTHVSGASLAAFRVAFGALMVWEFVRYLMLGRVREYYIDPAFHFTYFGFEWVRPWPEFGMYAHVALLIVASVGIAIGWRYRISAAVFAIGFSYLFLLEQARYLNHFYLIALMSGLMVIVAPHRQWSLDAGREPALRSTVVPAWMLWLLRVQIGLVYVYGGIAKLNGDWLRGEPLREWLRTDPSVLWAPLVNHVWAPLFFSYGGLIFDLTVAPFLVWRRTRPFAFAVAVGFHLANSQLFNIGVFPWFMIGATTLFFDPDWPTPLLHWARKKLPLLRSRNRSASLEATPMTRPAFRPAGRLLAVSLGALLLVQALVPLRHHLYPGNVAWTEEGHRFSWRMKLRDKEARAVFSVRDTSSGMEWPIVPEDYLAEWQADEMASRPDMVLQFAHYLRRVWANQGYEHVTVHALVLSTLNDHPPRLLVDPNVDLGREARSLRAARWILPPNDVRALPSANLAAGPPPPITSPVSVPAPEIQQE